MLAILFLSFVLSGFSQVVPAEAQEQLDELGLTEQELAAKRQREQQQAMAAQAAQSGMQAGIDRIGETPQ